MADSSPAGCRGPVAVCTPGLGSQPSNVLGSVNEYRLQLEMFKAGMCIVQSAMLLGARHSTSVVALSGGIITN